MDINEALQNIRQQISTWNLKHYEMPDTCFFVHQLDPEWHNNDLVKGLISALITYKCDTFWGCTPNLQEVLCFEASVESMLDKESVVDIIIANEENTLPKEFIFYDENPFDCIEEVDDEELEF